MRQILAARLACLFAGLAVGVAGCGSASSPPQESPTATVSFTSSTAAPASPPVSSSSSAAATPTNAPTQAAVPPPAGSALAALATLSVRGPGPMSGYSREEFGPAWADVKGNSCDTRVICTIQRHAHEAYE